LDRERRCGFAEVVFGLGKTPEQVAGIVSVLVARHGGALVSRATEEQAAAVQAELEIGKGVTVTWHARGRTIVVERARRKPAEGRVAVICAGTSDLPVAEEARITLEYFGVTVEWIVDVGVAGLHRLLGVVDRVRACDVAIVVAGMEGALPSAVAGLVDMPVIAVPTSVGYGASFGGLAALLGMLNSCGSGVTVVNIDNGFGAAYAAAQMTRLPFRRAERN
jgi:NCAIR mutase (PurE)-related protein